MNAKGAKSSKLVLVQTVLFVIVSIAMMSGCLWGAIMRPQNNHMSGPEIARSISPDQIHRINLESGHGNVWVVVEGQMFEVLVDERRKPLAMDVDAIDLESLFADRVVGIGWEDIRLSGRDQRQIIDTMYEIMADYRGYLDHFFEDSSSEFLVIMVFDE